MNSSIENRTRAAFGVALVVFVAISIATYTSAQRLGGEAAMLGVLGAMFWLTTRDQRARRRAETELRAAEVF